VKFLVARILGRKKLQEKRIFMDDKLLKFARNTITLIKHAECLMDMQIELLLYEIIKKKLAQV